MTINVIDSEQDAGQRYPIGKFDPSLPVAETDLQQFIQDIAALPAQMRQAVQGLTDEQLDTPYRPGGWSIRQVVHHVADSHMNSFIRFKLALTEDAPTIKPYEEALWSELPDSKNEPIEVSLVLLEALHHRWVVLLKSLSETDWQRVYIHPASGKTPLVKVAGLYAWHGKHHLAHISNLRELKEW